MIKRYKLAQSLQIQPGITLIGESRAAHVSGFYIPELKIMLDCGNPNLSNLSPEYIFITHCHSDHISEIAKILIGKNKVIQNIFCPISIRSRIRNLISAFFTLIKNTDSPKIGRCYTIIGAEPNLCYPLFFDKKTNQPKMSVEIIKCNHTVTSYGYGFTKICDKLKPEFQDLTQSELDELSKSCSLTMQQHVPLFCYLGDTNESVLYVQSIDGQIKYSEQLKKYPIIIIECTFLDKEHHKNAKEDKHMHWDKLNPYVIAHPDKHFILIHFSWKYSDTYINNFFEKLQIPNITIFINTPMTQIEEQIDVTSND